MTDTVKVRIAVAVGPDGKWAASGWRGAGDALMMDLALDSLGEGSGEARFWVTAELPIPYPVEVEGEVEDEKRPARRPRYSGG